MSDTGYINPNDGSGMAEYVEHRRVQRAIQERAYRGAALDPIARALIWADECPPARPSEH